MNKEQANNQTAAPEKKPAKKPAQKSAKPKGKKTQAGKGDMRWALFAQYYFDNKSESFNNAYQSAIRAGFSEAYAKNITTRGGVEKVRNDLAGALDRLGVDDKYLAKNIKELLDAEHIVIIKEKKIGKGETVVAEHTLLDSKAKNYGLTHAINIRGDKAPEKHTIGADEELMEALDKLRQVITVRPSGTGSKK